MKTRYAICGLSVRGINNFLLPLLGRGEGAGRNDFSGVAEVVGILDIDPARVRTFNEKLGVDIPFYDAAGGAAKMIEAARPDVLLVAGPDFTHAEHIIAGLEAGLRVISEKAVTATCEQMRRVLEAESRSAGRLTVAHNMRYTPLLVTVREIIASGKIGRVTNVEYAYNLDTYHGSSYFFRWNRERAKSGGLSIHKSVHHFDVLSWLVDSPPEMIFAFGARNYYGPEGAHNPQRQSPEKLTIEETRERCPYFNKHYRKRFSADAARFHMGWDPLDLPYDIQYPQEVYLYDKDIDIEDTYSVLLKFRSGASAMYSCNFSTPIEGYSLGINGTEGRIEAAHFVSSDPNLPCPKADPGQSVLVMPLFGEPETVEVPKLEGGHGGSDPVLQKDLFLGPSETTIRYKREADSYAGALSVACGEAVWRSSAEGRPFTVRELLGEWYRP